MGLSEESGLLLNSPPPIHIDIIQQPQQQTQQQQQQNNSNNNINISNSNSDNNIHNSNITNNDNNNNLEYSRKDLFSSPIFYSVFLGCFTYIVFVFRMLIGYNLFYIVQDLNQSWIYVVFSILSSIASPIIISRIKHKLSIILGFVVLFISYLFTNYTNNGIIQVFTSISNELLYTSIFSLIILVNSGTDFNKLLIFIYFIIYYSLQISLEYIPISNFNISGIYIALLIIGLLYIVLLPKPKEDEIEVGGEINSQSFVNESKKIFDLLPYPYIFNKETKLYYIVPVLIFIGITDGYLPFNPMIAAFTSLVISDFLYRFGRYRVFQMLMVAGFTSIISGFIHAISKHFDQFLILNEYPNLICLISYSIFKSGIILVFINMFCETIPKEKVLSIICTARLSQAIGSFIFSILSIGAVIYEVGWFLLLVYSIFALITFMLFLKSIQNKI